MGEQEKQQAKEGLEDFRKDNDINGDPVADKIEDHNEGAEDKAKGIKPEQAVELVAGLTANFVPDVDVKVQGQTINTRQHYKENYKQGKAEYLKMIDFEELTEGGDLSELPEWVRWTLAGGILLVPAGISIIQLRKEVAKMQKQGNKRKNKGKDKEDKEE